MSFCGKIMSSVCMNIGGVFNYYNGTRKNFDLVGVVDNGHFCYVFCYSFLTRLSDYI